MAIAGSLEGARWYGIRAITFVMTENGYGLDVNVHRGGKETVYAARTYETEGYGHILANQWDEGTGGNFKNLWFIDITP